MSGGRDVLDVAPMRADTAVIHARIIEVATEEFGAHGVEASLNAIAKGAHVGPGTLYRHFPTRESLIDACMQRWEAQLDRAARRVTRSGAPPERVLVNWLDALATQVSYFAGGPARLLRALDTQDTPWMRRWQIIDRANEAVVGWLVDAGALDPGLADRRQIGVLACSIAAAAEDAGLSSRQRRKLLRIVAVGLLESWSARAN